LILSNQTKGTIKTQNPKDKTITDTNDRRHKWQDNMNFYGNQRWK